MPTKIAKGASSAFFSGRRYRNSNTIVQPLICPFDDANVLGIGMLLHGRCIAWRPEKAPEGGERDIWIQTAGYASRTALDRIRVLLGDAVHVVDGRLCLFTFGSRLPIPWSGNWVRLRLREWPRVPYGDGTKWPISAELSGFQLRVKTAVQRAIKSGDVEIDIVAKPYLELSNNRIGGVVVLTSRDRAILDAHRLCVLLGALQVLYSSDLENMADRQGHILITSEARLDSFNVVAFLASMVVPFPPSRF